MMCLESSKKCAVVVALLTIVITSFSCSKEGIPPQLDVQVDSYSDLYDYSIWGEIISAVFTKPEAQSLYLSALKNNWLEERSIPLGLVLINNKNSLLPFLKK